MLNNHAPTALHRVWRQHVLASPRLPPGPKPTATVYHFGHDEETGALVQYAYRSTADFKGEFRPGPVFAVKPQPNFAFEPPTDIEQWVELCKQLRDQDDALPPGEGVGIGGELILTTIQNSMIIQVPLFRWPDYDDKWNEMNERAFEAHPAQAAED